MTRFVTRALSAVQRYNPAPEQIDHAILSAINVNLCMLSGGNARVSEGFNADIALSGRAFHTDYDYRGLVHRQVMQREIH